MPVISLFVILTAIDDHCPNPNSLEVEKYQYSDSVNLHVLARFLLERETSPNYLFGYQDV